AVPETSEGNNCLTSTETVTVEGTPPADVDLIVTSVSDPPAHALPGQPFSVSVKVQNKGTDTSAASNTKFFLVGSSVKKNVKGLEPVGPLAGGATDGPTTATLQVFSDTLPGTYTLQACADGDDTNVETDETNNCTLAANSIIVDQAPDLIVSALSNPPTTAQQGSTFTIQNTAVKTNGPGDAPQPSVTKYFLVSLADGSRKDLSGTLDVPALAAGHTFNNSDPVSLTIQGDTGVGRYHLQACADSGKADLESDENNNCKTTVAAVNVTARPDLVVTSVTVAGNPASVARLGSLTITATVTNTGGVKITKLSIMKFQLLNTVGGGTKNLKGIATIPQPIAENGGSVQVQGTVTVFGDTPLGTYQVQACADSTKVILEANEKNNCGSASGTLTITAQ